MASTFKSMRSNYAHLSMIAWMLLLRSLASIVSWNFEEFCTFETEIWLWLDVVMRTHQVLWYHLKLYLHLPALPLALHMFGACNMKVWDWNRGLKKWSMRHLNHCLRQEGFAPSFFRNGLDGACWPFSFCEFIQYYHDNSDFFDRGHALAVLCQIKHTIKHYRLCSCWKQTSNSKTPSRTGFGFFFLSNI